MRFIKMHGLGNDFVILDHRNGASVPAPKIIKKMSDRRLGVGCDQLIIMEPSDKADLFMRIYNSDGSEAESCGNATRCVAHLLMEESGRDSCILETLRGLLPCRRVGDLVEADMGPPKEIKDIEHEFAGYKNPVSVDAGNPHAVFFVENVLDIALEQVGPLIENNSAFPHKTNVEFVQLLDDGTLRVRVWERGAGVTPACGSGACATIVAAVHRGVTGRKADIEMDGGVLRMQWCESDDHMLMIGPVAYVFEGQWHGR